MADTTTDVTTDALDGAAGEFADVSQTSEALTLKSDGVEIKPELEQMAMTAARACDDKKAEDVVCLHIGAIADVSDYFVICHAPNHPLADAVSEHVIEVMREELGIKPLSVEGDAGEAWAIIDFGQVVVHIFHPEARELYRLEALWRQAPVVDWES